METVGYGAAVRSVIGIKRGVTQTLHTTYDTLTELSNKWVITFLKRSTEIYIYIYIFAINIHISHHHRLFLP